MESITTDSSTAPGRVRHYQLWLPLLNYVCWNSGIVEKEEESISAIPLEEDAEDEVWGRSARSWRSVCFTAKAQCCLRASSFWDQPWVPVQSRADHHTVITNSPSLSPISFEDNETRQPSSLEHNEPDNLANERGELSSQKDDAILPSLFSHSNDSMKKNEEERDEAIDEQTDHLNQEQTSSDWF